jgi:hypothetical protein
MWRWVIRRRARQLALLEELRGLRAQQDTLERQGQALLELLACHNAAHADAIARCEAAAQLAHDAALVQSTVVVEDLRVRMEAQTLVPCEVGD